uniref:Cell wall hydroxyproline-rich glycoprotein n=1 Tax=Glycine max TaxID=3847 RepID=K7KSX0_SOYBN
MSSEIVTKPLIWPLTCPSLPLNITLSNSFFSHLFYKSLGAFQGSTSHKMATSYFLLLSLFLLSSSVSHALSNVEASFIVRRQLLHLHENDELSDNYADNYETNLTFPNPRLKSAYIALEALKKAIYSDPSNFTANWEGPNVCSYNGVFCEKALDDPKIDVVAGIDLNHADIAGYIPPEIGLLTDLALFHINSNRFCGVLPKSFSKLKLLYELDISNNRFVGRFPEPVLLIPDIKFLDLRFNEFEGELPSELFNKSLDAIFLNNNRFTSTIPQNMGSSPASVMVFAYNNLTGCLPSSIGNMTKTLNEFVLINNNLTGCLPAEIGKLEQVYVFDISQNNFVGMLPRTFDGLKNAEHLSIGHNKLTGFVPRNVCSLPNLVNFTFSYNYFNGEEEGCVPPKKDVVLDDENNCIPNRPKQKVADVCNVVISKHVDCKCGSGTHLILPILQQHHLAHHQNLHLNHNLPVLLKLRHQSHNLNLPLQHQSHNPAQPLLPQR